MERPSPSADQQFIGQEKDPLSENQTGRRCFQSRWTRSHRQNALRFENLHPLPRRKIRYLSQSSIPLYFGLGDAAQIDRIEVLWPSGKKQMLTEKIPINTLLTITEER